MNKYVFKLCSLGIPACNAYAIVCDFLKNFNVEALEEYIADLERYDKSVFVVKYAYKYDKIGVLVL